MNFQTFDSRDRRSFLNHSLSFGPMHYTIANYSTQAQKSKKSNLESFDEEILSKISSIPDPLKKNLADTVLTNNKGAKMTSDDKEFFYSAMPEEKEVSSSRTDFYPSISNITSFFSNVFGAISGAMFHRRPKSPVTQYHDCFDTVIGHEMASDWHGANINDQNKNKAPDSASTELNDNMNNCKSAAVHCEDKLNVVRDLLKNKPVARAPKTRLRRPRRAFVEPSSVEDSYEEDFISDQYVSLSNEEYIEYFSRPNTQNQVYSEIDAPKMKVESVPAENTEIVKVIPEVPAKSEPVITPAEALPDKKEIISSCEDKMAKLKLLLLEKRKKPVQNDLYDSTDSITEPLKEKPPKKPTKVVPIEKKQDKRFKNPNRLAEKRTRSRMLKNIQDDMVFAHEIDSEHISSVNDSLILTPVVQRVPSTPTAGSVESLEYFDELKGKFHSQSTTDSDDSFQIVFTDSPRQSRMWRPSECDSEDSFIVFEDSPDSCYTSNDVFGEESEIEDETESDSELSDSGCAFDVCKLTHNLSRTVSDLTDDSLYEDTQIAKPIEIDTITEAVDDLSETIDECSATATIDESSACCATADDEVDCAVRTFDVIPETDTDSGKSVVLPGLLIDDKKKCLRKNLPSKKVTFSEKPPKVHVMRVWTFAARQARAGHWERHALDRERFKRRIADVDMAVSWVLKPQHRSRVMFQRFMPWWNQLKRKEAAEKKLRVEEAKRLAEEVEEERRSVEETKRIEVENTKELEIENKEGIEVENTKGIDVESTKGIEVEETKRVDEEKKMLKENAQQLQATASKEQEEQEVTVPLIDKVNPVVKDNTNKSNNENRNSKIAVVDVTGIENSKVVTELFKKEGDEKLKLKAASHDVDSKRVGTGNEKIDGVVRVNTVNSVESGRRKADKKELSVETKNIDSSKGNGVEIAYKKLETDKSANEAVVKKDSSDKNRNTIEPNSIKFKKHKTDEADREEKIKEIEQVSEKIGPIGNLSGNSDLNKNLKLPINGNQLVEGKCKNVEISNNQFHRRQ